jgi:hypothetical protein
MEKYADNATYVMRENAHIYKIILNREFFVKDGIPSLAEVRPENQ